MEEGNEPSTEQKIPGSHLGEHEHKLIFGLVFFVLIAIALFLAVILITPVGDRLSLGEQKLSNEEMTAENFYDVPNRDKELLGLVIHKDLGRYYAHPKTKMTLYFSVTGICEGGCLQDFEPYINTAGVHLAMPDGVSLFLHKHDVFPGDAKGAGFNGVWSIARP